jgi:hypothetical protein
VIDKQRTIPVVPDRTPFFVGEDFKPLERTWIQFFMACAARGVELAEDTHDRIGLYSAARHKPGTEYYKTDWQVWYEARIDGEWHYKRGTYRAAFADRPAAASLGTNDAGLLFYATDYLHTWRWTGSAWEISSGTMRGTLDPDEKPSDLDTEDEGFLFYSTDFEHTFRWDGSAWEFAPGDPGTGLIGWFTTAPSAGRWQICDGTAGVAVCTPTGGTTTFTAPNLIGAYIKGAAAGYTGAQVAAVAPGLTGETADEDAHTHDIDHNHPSQATGAPSATTSVQSGGGATVASSTHGHDVDLPAFSGASGAGSAHKHGVGTLEVDDTGEPAHMLAIPYIRV